MKTIEFDACKLTDLIMSEYGVDFSVPSFMEGQRKITMDVYNGKIDDDVLADFKENGKNVEDPDDVLECVLADLCFRKKLKAGYYLICFDD